MQIIRVQEKDPFIPVAIEIGEDLDVTLLAEIVVNTYGKNESYVGVRREGTIGEGGIDVRYGEGDYEREYIPKGQTGWLVLGERWAIFYRNESIWTEYEKVN